MIKNILTRSGKFGFITINTKQGNRFTYRIRIINEFETDYEIKYLELVKIQGNQDATLEIVRNSHDLRKKVDVVNIHEKKFSIFAEMDGLVIICGALAIGIVGFIIMSAIIHKL